MVSDTAKSTALVNSISVEDISDIRRVRRQQREAEYQAGKSGKDKMPSPPQDLLKGRWPVLQT